MSDEVIFWNKRYSSERYAYGLKPNNFLKNNAKIFKPNGKILCLAEGEGRNAVYLAKLDLDIYCVDFSVEAHKKALELAQKNNVKINYQIGDLATFEMEHEKWDGIVGIFSHVSAKTRKELFQKIKLGLKKDGIFLLEGYNKNQINNNTGGPKNLEMLFDLDELKTAFSDFKILKSENIEKEINEGEFHKGISSVVDFIAVK